ncbi:MAG: hypothetical protein R2779_07310 [Crocinitomicaceae bacterium]
MALFLGLAYPILVAILFITIIYWLLMRKWKWCLRWWCCLPIGISYFLRLFALEKLLKHL